MIAEELFVALQPPEPGGPGPRHRQIHEQLRVAILEGRLRPGDRLPSTRELAARLGLARNTVGRAYADLLAEGYLSGQVGSGTYVATALGGDRRPARSADEAGDPEATPVRPLTEWATRALRTIPGVGRAAGLPIDFRPGTPDWAAFPHAQWLRLLGRAVRGGAAELARYGEPAGYLPLRAAIARHLALSRGVEATAERVVIVSGVQQGIDLLTRLLVWPGDGVVVEDPGYPEARRAFAAAGARVVHVPVDADGLDVQRLVKRTANIQTRLVYVTPSHQFPTGAILPLARRLALLKWAERNDALIVEDDYDSEFRYAGRPIESLQGLDRTGRVVYLGTFSTVLFPPLRVGYAVLPADLVEPFVRAKWLADRQTSTLEQLALTDFLGEGHYATHLRRMRRLAAERRTALLAAVSDSFGGEVEPLGTSSGMHLTLRLSDRGGASAAEIERGVVERAAALGVGVYPLGPYCVERTAPPSLVLGYAALPAERIREGIRLLAAQGAS